MHHIQSKPCQKSFLELNSQLITALVLAFPDLQEVFIDKSDMGVGAILSQKYPDGERVVTYARKTSSQQEYKHSAAHIESLAVITFTYQFRHH